MSLRIIWSTIARWRWIMIPFLLLALGGGAFVFLNSPRTFTVDSSFLFLSPVKDIEGVAGNPFLQQGSGVPQTVDVLAVSLADEATVRQLTKSAPDLKYTATRNLAVGAPLMTITVEYTDLAQARKALDTLGGLLQDRLSQLQSNAAAPASQYITLTQLTDNQKPELGYSDPIRNGVLVLFGILGLGFLTVAIAERASARRESRRSADAASADDTVEPSASVEPAAPELTLAKVQRTRPKSPAKSRG
ncbi:hypothetical protein BH10ACT4_BH10ACT4_06940 [soil metagenome]